MEDLTMIGQLLTGRYLILKQLGEGGFSKTYLAIDKYLLDQPACVVKCLRPPLNSAMSVEKVQQLFEVEARSLDRLGAKCSGIPTLLAYCHEQNNFYLVEEYVKGENLETRFNRGYRLTLKELICLLKEILHILKYVHYHRIIHCDIKPSNLILRENQDIALIDFGAAFELNDRQQNKQTADENYPLAIGTFGYMPDEQKQGFPQFNSDIYALGVSVIQLLTGIPPHQLQVDPASGELIWHSHLPEWNSDPRLVSILDQMIRRDHRLRYQNVAEVSAALEALSISENYSRRRKQIPAPKQRPANSLLGPEIWKPIVMLLSMIAIGAGGYLSLSRTFPPSRQAEAPSIQKVLQLRTEIFNRS